MGTEKRKSLFWDNSSGRNHLLLRLCRNATVLKESLRVAYLLDLEGRHYSWSSFHLQQHSLVPGGGLSHRCQRSTNFLCAALLLLLQLLSLVSQQSKAALRRNMSNHLPYRVLSLPGTTSKHGWPPRGATRKRRLKCTTPLGSWWAGFPLLSTVSSMPHTIKILSLSGK